MTLKEKIITAIDKVPENRLAEVFELIQKLQESEEQPGFLRRLQGIKITDLPPDYSRNIDLYLSGEEKIDENSD